MGRRNCRRLVKGGTCIHTLIGTPACGFAPSDDGHGGTLLTFSAQAQHLAQSIARFVDDGTRFFTPDPIPALIFALHSTLASSHV